jgi:GTP-binding protein HflX
LRAVERIVGELGYGEIPRLLVLNKADRLREQDLADLLAAHDGAVALSALQGTGVDELLERIDRALRAERQSPPARPQPSV